MERPKRRKYRDNPYTLEFKENKYYIRFKDITNNIQIVEVSEEVYKNLSKTLVTFKKNEFMLYFRSFFL